MTAKDLKNALLQEAVQGRLVPQIASEGNARDLLEEIRKEKLSHGLDLRLEASLAINAKSGKRKSKKETALAGSNPCDITEEEIPFDIPESWCWCRLIDVLKDKPSNGISPKEVKYETKIRSLSLSATTSGVFDSNAFKYVELDNNTASKYWLKKNDLLIQRSNSRELVGTSCIYYGDDNLFIYPDLMMRMQVQQNIKLAYIDYVLKSPHVRNYFSKNASGTSDSMPKINQTIVCNTLIPLPPLAEQKRIVAAIEKFMPLIEEYGKKETQLKAINEKIGTLTKKAILQEAVQGKLVPQIAAEGNAKDLLEEIKKEKSKLIKEGKIKKEKPLPEITEDEIPFDIPENWCWCRLSDFCNLYTGNSINETEKKTKYTNLKEGRFYIGTKDIGFDSVINYDNGVRIPFENANFRIADTNTILMCIEGGSAGRKIAFTNQLVCFGNKLCCFNSYKNEIEKFIFYFLQSTLFTDAFKDNINGIIGGVSINNLKGMLFPLPPLAEQKRIVDVIEKMLPLCEKLGE